MPTYEYECTNGHQFEAEQRITEKPLERCEVCRAKVRRLISATSFILKGGGWYADGYSGKSKGSDNGSGAASSNGKAAAGNSENSSSSSDSSSTSANSTSNSTSSDKS